MNCEYWDLESRIIAYCQEHNTEKNTMPDADIMEAAVHFDPDRYARAGAARRRRGRWTARGCRAGRPAPAAPLARLLILSRIQDPGGRETCRWQGRLWEEAELPFSGTAALRRATARAVEGVATHAQAACQFMSVLSAAPCAFSFSLVTGLGRYMGGPAEAERVGHGVGACAQCGHLEHAEEQGSARCTFCGCATP